MSASKSVKICINGMFYPISTSEPEDYVLGIAQELDEQVHTLMAKNPSISFNDVMVLCCVNYADAYKRGEENADRMRAQITEYLEDAAKARIELDEVKRENAHLRRQIDGQEMKGQTKLGASAAAAKSPALSNKLDALGQTKLETPPARASVKPETVQQAFAQQAKDDALVTAKPETVASAPQSKDGASNKDSAAPKSDAVSKGDATSQKATGGAKPGAI